LIGFGEAGFTSIAPTVLADLFTEEGRTAALALFYFAIPVGSGLGYMVGSSVAHAAGDWRWGLRVTPFLNLLAVVLMIFFLEDPERGEKEAKERGHNGEVAEAAPAAGGSRLVDYLDDLVYLIKNKTFILTTLAFTFLTFFTGSLSWWGPIFMEDAIKVAEEYGQHVPVSRDSVAFVFGVVLSVAGVLGLALGSGLSYKLRETLPWVDPVICGLGLLASAPFCLAAVGFARESAVAAFALVFVGEIFLNMNWAIIVDISLYVVVPTRRSSAEAFQLMLSHALGEAGSPYITGLIAGAIDDAMEDWPTRNPSRIFISLIIP